MEVELPGLESSASPPAGSVLVTGGAGYIGSHTVWALTDAGHPVVVLDDLSTGRRAALPASVPLVEGSVGDAALVGALLRRHGIGTIIHFAGSVLVGQSVTDPLGYYANNTVASHALIGAAIAAGIRQFIFSSTAAVYGVQAQQPIAETAPTQPINPYGWSKLMTETMLTHVAAATGLRFVILRYFNVAGADAALRTGERRPQPSHLINVATKAALGLLPELPVFGDDYDTPDGTCIRDYLHVSDLACAHVQALEHLAQGGASLIANCGYGHGISVRQVIDRIELLIGRKLKLRLSPRRLGDPPMLVATAERIRDTLQWRPRFDDLDTIIGSALAWEDKLARAPSPVAHLA
jgi:UDP-glucose 4-epimerase